MQKIKMLIGVTIILSFFSGCIERYDYDDGCERPIYLSYEKLRSNYPSIEKPREIKKAGKIYVYGDTLLINEKGKGIHVVDNRVKETPIRKKFIDIPGNIDLAVKDGYLYVDSFIDLVILDIRDIDDIKIVNRKEEVFPYDAFQVLTQKELNENRCYRSYDKDRGVVVGYK
jgi:hypothetical protein